MRVLNDNEARRLLAAIDPLDVFAERDRSICVLGLNTGLRVSELAGLDVHHVAWQGAPRSALHLPAALAKESAAYCKPFLPL